MLTVLKQVEYIFVFYENKFRDRIKKGFKGRKNSLEGIGEVTNEGLNDANMLGRKQSRETRETSQR